MLAIAGDGSTQIASPRDLIGHILFESGAPKSTLERARRAADFRKFVLLSELQMNRATNGLLTSAVLGILSAPSCAGQQSPTAIPTHGSQPSSLDKSSCGSHEPGKCGAVAPTARARSSQPLSLARTETIAPGKHFEVDLMFASAVQAKMTYDASGIVSWNIHSHSAGEMIEHRKGEGSNETTLFVPAAPGVYSFIWKNTTNAPITLTLALTSERDVSKVQH